MKGSTIRKRLEKIRKQTNEILNTYMWENRNTRRVNIRDTWVIQNSHQSIYTLRG